jgi:hypothetical protein
MTDLAHDIFVTPDEQARLDAAYAKLNAPKPQPATAPPLNRHLVAHLDALRARVRRAA